MERFKNEIIMDIREFILDTLLPYKEDPSTCATNGDGGCSYLTDDGKKCAVGKHMKQGRWQQSGYGVNNPAFEFELEEILLPDSYKMIPNIEGWYLLQKYHDSIALHKYSLVCYCVKDIESHFNIKLPELYI